MSYSGPANEFMKARMAEPRKRRSPDVKLITLLPPGKQDDKWLVECSESAKGQGKHVVVNVADGGLFQARKDGYSWGGMVACLDYDDRLVSGAVRACVDALESTRAGIAFTWEARMDESGRRTSERRGPVTQRHLATMPESIHHLAVIRSELLPGHILELAEHVAPLCVDWIVKSYLAFKFGAVQVPMVGYEWRFHGDQITQKHHSEWSRQLPLARSLIRTWAPTDFSVFSNFPIYGVAKLAPVPPILPPPLPRTQLTPQPQNQGWNDTSVAPWLGDCNCF
jgi:hypothetical protein